MGPSADMCAYLIRLNPEIFHFRVFRGFASKTERAANAEPRWTTMRHASVTEISTAEITALGYRESISRLIRLVILMLRSAVTREALSNEPLEAMTHGEFAAWNAIQSRMAL